MATISLDGRSESENPVIFNVLVDKAKNYPLRIQVNVPETPRSPLVINNGTQLHLDLDRSELELLAIQIKRALDSYKFNPITSIT